ncbi:DMT family transporter [Verminephrobacter eiseniae]|uniref:EamA domain-containing protein n=1 Tax=Verminephrobacter eiseniae (strain EF01-2) TaxID=391735 RepID=A1WJ03_VEREI|nr:DMT family transporter [Verminephrobacter eiseniae]ABM57610.1 protein of unknown function DUF6, transmembrane [Verminephrobacter eiseniae EF01-2]MCW5283231.1 DMT family transporter [Verminephrobacter eiseniae]MCW5303547.1 DMT family transporter [Verminephrobacter eiseniae]MCW8178721.1 DMT family transporter [Verminephrobacter eiseniae]MCW8188341.1 DMT family transporter [Verminephrobacter eiseniae]
MKTTPNTAVLLTLLATFFWGSNFQATRFALSGLPPWTASVERFLIAVAGIFLIMAIKEGVRRDILSRNLLAFILLGVIGVAGFNGALFVGLQSASPITASLIMATTPISANIIEAILGKRMPGMDRIIGMAISLVGVSLVITEGQILSGHLVFASGDLIILAGSICWAAYTVGTRAFVSGATPLETTGWTMLFGTIALVIVAFICENPIQAAIGGTGLSFAATLWMGTAGSVLAYLFWNVGIAVRGPGKTSIFFNFVPVFALLIQLTMGIVPHAVQIIGIVITILGVFVGQGRFSGLLFKRSAVSRK